MLRLTRALALLFIAACSVVTVTWASVALPVELDGLTLEQQVNLRNSSVFA